MSAPSFAPISWSAIAAGGGPAGLACRAPPLRQVPLHRGRPRPPADGAADDGGDAPTRTDGEACSSTPSPRPPRGRLLPNSRTAGPSAPTTAAPPPRLDQVRIRRVLGLEHELP